MRGSLNPEAEEGGILGREFEADIAIDHRNRFRGHGEGSEGHEIGLSPIPKLDLASVAPREDVWR